MKYLLLSFCLSFSALAQTTLSEAIPFPFHDVHKISEGKSNNLMIINSGIAALEQRLNMIRKAKDHIEVEYFIYGLDESTKIFTQELILASKRGVKVRILIDKSAAVFEFDEYYAKVLAENNIEVRYYNAAPIYRVSTIQFRNHRKLLEVDDKMAITGGRNIENDYFDLSDKFNFVDTDVYIEGDMAKTMRLTFDEYFDAKMAEHPKFPKRHKLSLPQHKKKYDKKLAAAHAFLELTDSEKELQSKITVVGEEILGGLKMHACPELTYTTDHPDGSFWTRLVDKYSDDYRFVRKTLYDKISKVDKSVLLVSPYMINNKYSHSLMDDLLKRNVEINLYTNSLASTDAVYVAANLYLDIPAWTKDGINIHVHDGLFMNEFPVVNEKIKEAKWGVHTKAHVYESTDSSEIMIGTYNIDNRSNHYNSEMAIFCKGSDELTAELKNSITERMDNGYEIASDGSATNKNGKSVNVMGADPNNKLLMRLITLPSWMLKFLL